MKRTRSKYVGRNNHDKEEILKPVVKDIVTNPNEVKALIDVAAAQEAALIKKHTSVQTETLKSVRLQEVAPYVGIFRGCASGDCSTQYSFPYPNDPHERVFFVYPDGKDSPKGIVSATIVESEGKKALYVITLQGNLSGPDVLSILHGLESHKKDLGVDKIILPEESRSGGLINNPAVRAVVDREAIRGTVLPITYQDQNIRTEIQRYRDYNNGHYDHMVSNPRGREFVPQKELLEALDTSLEKRVPKEIILPELTKASALSFALDLSASNRMDVAKKVLILKGLDENRFSEILKILENKENKPLDVFLGEANDAVRSMLGNEYSSEIIGHKEHLIYSGVLNSPDLFSDTNYKNTMRMLRNDVKDRYQNWDNPKAGWDFINKNLVHLEKDSGWNEMINNLILEAHATPETIRRFYNYTKIPITKSILNLEKSSSHEKVQNQLNSIVNEMIDQLHSQDSSSIARDAREDAVSTMKYILISFPDEAMKDKILSEFTKALLNPDSSEVANHA